MDNSLYGEKFINMMRTIIPSLKPCSGNREIVVRCPYCGDSKDLKHAHFYISVPMNNTELSWYDCKKCPAKGLLDDEVLRKLGCDNTQVLVSMIERNNVLLNTPKYKLIKNIDIYFLQNKYVRNDIINIQKLEYINNRIGSNYSIQDVLELKIFLNLYDVINSNKLEITRHKSICDDLDKYFIGFISYDNSFCGMRKITDKELYKTINKRYVNYNLVNKTNDRKNFYVIPTSVDVLNPQPIKIHIAEGQFDILSIFHNLNNDNKYQNIYISIGGKSYLGALEFILIETGIINYEIHYYPDRDVSDYEFNRITYKINNLVDIPIYIHRNIYDGEKDFGVPMGRIKESIIRLK